MDADRGPAISNRIQMKRDGQDYQRCEDSISVPNEQSALGDDTPFHVFSSSKNGHPQRVSERSIVQSMLCVIAVALLASATRNVYPDRVAAAQSSTVAHSTSPYTCSLQIQYQATQALEAFAGLDWENDVWSARTPVSVSDMVSQDTLRHTAQDLQSLLINTQSNAQWLQATFIVRHQCPQTLSTIVQQSVQMNHALQLSISKAGGIYVFSKQATAYEIQYASSDSAVVTAQIQAIGNNRIGLTTRLRCYNLWNAIIAAATSNQAAIAQAFSNKFVLTGCAT